MSAQMLRAIGDRVRRRRERLGWSQTALADLLGVAPSQISRIEAGQQSISVVRLLDIADALETTPGRLLGGRS